MTGGSPKVFGESANGFASFDQPPTASGNRLRISGGALRIIFLFNVSAPAVEYPVDRLIEKYL
jgi:hypothetical protein